MFKKEKESEKTNGQNLNIDPNSRNLIAVGTSIVGEVVCDGVIRFDGKLKGNLVTAGKLVIGPSGAIIGDIKCKNADIEGTVEGKIIVSELLTLKTTAKMKGEIITRKLAVEAGASFNGTCSMTSTPESDVLLNKDDKKQVK